MKFGICIKILEHIENAIQWLEIFKLYNYVIFFRVKALVNNQFYESFDITFMGNEKSCQNINFFFFHKNFL